MDLGEVELQTPIPQSTTFPAAYAFSGAEGYQVTDTMRRLKSEIYARGFVFVDPVTLEHQILKQLGAPPSTVGRYLNQVGDDTPIHNIPVMKFRRMGGVRFSYRKDFRMEGRQVWTRKLLSGGVFEKNQV